MSVTHSWRDFKQSFETKKKLNWNNEPCYFVFNLIKVELELAAMEIMETPLLERIETLALLGFRI